MTPFWTPFGFWILCICFEPSVQGQGGFDGRKSSGEAEDGGELGGKQNECYSRLWPLLKGANDHDDHQIKSIEMERPPPEAISGYIVLLYVLCISDCTYSKSGAKKVLT